MRRKFNRTQRNYIIAGLCMILVIMGVGYAAFQSQLRISGTSNISGSFNIQITNIETTLPSESGGSGILDGYNISEPTYTPTSATFSAGFELPGSMIGYIVEVSNLGSIDGQVTIGNLSCGDNSAIMCQAAAIDEGQTNGFNFDYGNQDYSDINFSLKVGEKHYIMVMVRYDDVTEQPTDLDASIKLDLTYEQYIDPNRPIPSGETTLIGGQKVEVVDSGDGLYEDEYTEGRYVYRGSNPNNYITFNNETWRIIAKEVDGTYKILRNDILPEEMPFDQQGARTSGYCSNMSYGCNAWASTANMLGSPSTFVNGPFSGVVEGDATLNKYLNDEYYNAIDVSSRNIILNHTWNIGGVVGDDNANGDLSLMLDEETKFKWNGNVALASATDYLNANSNQAMCNSCMLNYTNLETCVTTNWMFSDGVWWWLVSPDAYSGFAGDEFTVYGDGGLINGDANYSRGVRPAVYLSSSISLTGEGTQSNPYKIN